MELGNGHDLRPPQLLITPCDCLRVGFLRGAAGDVVEPIGVPLSTPPEIHHPVPGIDGGSVATDGVHGATGWLKGEWRVCATDASLIDLD